MLRNGILCQGNPSITFWCGIFSACCLLLWILFGGLPHVADSCRKRTDHACKGGFSVYHDRRVRIHSVVDIEHTKQLIGTLDTLIRMESYCVYRITFSRLHEKVVFRRNLGAITFIMRATNLAEMTKNFVAFRIMKRNKIAIGNPSLAPCLIYLKMFW